MPTLAFGFTLTTCLARIRASVGYSGRPAMVHLLFFGSFHFEAPVLSRSCGTPFELRYLCTAVCGAVPTKPYNEPGPLCGTVCPILISVSVAPGSYFFSAAQT